jgi:ATP-dependent RNA helicase SUPV3L1/SUV3
MFLGSDTMIPIVEALVPHADVQRHPRMSKLSHLGHRKLGSLPRRTALVAFSAAEVYALAEQVRQRHGGAAVVLGALSPRTRNAQVALFQSGEVPIMVATDAIGMGLNMDVAHVAFTSLRKFDGFDNRTLSPAEVGQIAGRAGRYTRDGTFGSTGTLTDIAPDVLLAVESHAFPPVRKLWWRNTDLDFGSIADLRESLLRAPPNSLLLPARNEEDAGALDLLAGLTEVRDRASTPERMRLLWQVCQLPDFRKTLPEEHVKLLARIYTSLVDRGELGREWLLRQIAHLDRPEGDIDRLASRLAHVRTWTYLSHRDAWLEDAPAVQTAAREVEDRLGDALHVALTARFVDRRGMAFAAAQGGTVRPDGEVRVGGFVVGTLHGITWKPAEASDRVSERAALRALAGEVDDRIQRLVDAPGHAFTWTDDGTIAWEGGAVARLAPGPDVLEPAVKPLRNDLLGPAALQRVDRRVRAHARDLVALALGPLAAAQGLPPDAQGLVFGLSRALGCVAAVPPGIFSRDERGRLASHGVRLGSVHTYVLPLLEGLPAWAGDLGFLLESAPGDDAAPRASAALRALLWRVAHGERDAAGLARACGMPRVGNVHVRADVLEVVANAARDADRRTRGRFRPEDLDVDGVVPPEVVTAVVVGLGWGATGRDGRRR